MAVAIVITSLALFFIPTTLIVLGYYSSQPTGNLISPLPQGTLSQQTQPTPEAASEITPTSAPTPTINNQPIIAAPNEATQTASPNTSNINSNIIDKVATLEPGSTEIQVKDTDVTDQSQIYLSPRPGDKEIYSLRSKTGGSFVISAANPSDVVRYIDYHIVNP